ncbi:MAG: alpha-hydroxy-acid oxidizing enzyme [Methanobacteriales archaeon HGW-Methanobacteriales-1]|jgi:isopentenyl diphosphate isomerase/L-lactate dehydrogenase-like FMN-dependent dehydrogenase/rubredoxin|nr:MAG: alpha-hydroxy-acid oxidizing enzyme [Methanobacteriales archaeon HGW-Methanobacteriales-1]
MKYICTYCNVFAYDEEKGDLNANLNPGTSVKDISDSWGCPVCGKPKEYLKKVSEDVFNLKMREYLGNQNKNLDLNHYHDIARKMLTGTCGVYSICDGQPNRLCSGQKFGAPIGMGGAGQGKTFEANYNALQEYRLKMRVIKPHEEPNMSFTIFKKNITAPILGAGLSGVKLSLNNAIPEKDFYTGLLNGAKAFGSIGLIGNTPSAPEDLGVNTIGEKGGFGIPIFKPQSQERLLKLFKIAEEQDVIALGVDLEGAGSTFWTSTEKRVYRKSENELQELVDSVEKPVIFKGIMGSDDALKVLDSGASACYVSNHGGRVMDCGQGVAEVLPEVAHAISSKIPIMADGAVRTGFDVLKILALGGDAALIGRPLAHMAIAGGEIAVKMYLDYVKDDLRRAMILTGCDNLKEVSRGILVK